MLRGESVTARSELQQSLTEAIQVKRFTAIVLDNPGDAEGCPDD